MKLCASSAPRSPIYTKKTANARHKLFRWCALLFIAALVSMMLACASPIAPSPTPPAALLARCPPLAPLADGTGAALLSKIVEVSGQYYACAARLDALIDAVR